jgi:hypothetical protein
MLMTVLLPAVPGCSAPLTVNFEGDAVGVDFVFDDLVVTPTP